MADFKMSSNRPYLLRAMYEWIIDNQCTPHLLVDVRDERVKVPREHVRDGQIVLNINPSAVGQFHWDNEHVEFSARFAGVARNMWIPMTAVLAIYARENGEGMAFTVESEVDETSEVEPSTAPGEITPERMAVTEKEPAPQNEHARQNELAPKKKPSPIRPAKPLRDVSSTAADDEPTPPPAPPSGGGRSHLKIVK